ncbi:MAG: substrate-binding domain-containing protein [Nitrospirota bacterium]|nr:substrate-binding domain-containing protein [Nitrospirota bacterium]
MAIIAVVMATLSKNEEYPEIPSTRRDDLHNLKVMEEAQLVLFMAGNQYMVMEKLLEAFKKRHPEVERIFYETLPPGLELRQILAGGALFQGRTITGRPDIYTSVTKDATEELAIRGLVDEYHIYLHNRIILMVPEGNPANIRNVSDLGRDDVRISQPGALEDITKYIVDMYERAGGKALVRRIMEEKRAEGTTILTIVHHRETPLRLQKGTVDVGPVWATEAVHAKREGLGFEVVEVGERLDQRHSVNYYITKLRKAPNPQNAEKFLSFILSREAQMIYESYGFVPYAKV